MKGLRGGGVEGWKGGGVEGWRDGEWRGGGVEGGEWRGGGVEGVEGWRGREVEGWAKKYRHAKMGGGRKAEGSLQRRMYINVEGGKWREEMKE